MARASCSDRHTITALKAKHVTEGKHIVFDFTSKVIDFFTINAMDGGKGNYIYLFIYFDCFIFLSSKKSKLF